jgi:hypothetical protein
MSNHDESAVNEMRRRYAAIAATGVPDPINQFLISIGLASPVKATDYRLPDPPPPIPQEWLREHLPYTPYPQNSFGPYPFSGERERLQGRLEAESQVTRRKK